MTKLVTKTNTKPSVFKYVEGSVDPQAYNNQLNINVRSIRGQRWLNKSRAKSLLKKKGGYDRGQYRPVLAMAVPAIQAREWVETQKNPAEWDSCFDHGISELGQYAIFLFDGQKRKYMLTETDPSIATFPIAVIYFTDKVTTGNTLFNDFNKYQLETVNAESLFINDVMAGDAKSIELVNGLIAAGLCVADKDDVEVVPESAMGDITIPSININSWRVVNDQVFGKNTKAIVNAVAVIKEALAIAGDPQAGRTPIYGWFLAGLAELLARRPSLMKKPEPYNGMVQGLARCLDYHQLRQKKMLDALRLEAESKPKTGIDSSHKGLNSLSIWALVLASALNTHGAKHVKNHSVMQNATSVSSLIGEVFYQPTR